MRSSEDGFTIIELLIATAVFSIILIISSTTLIGISQTYIRGSVEDETQQTARTVLSDISQDLEFNDPNGIITPTSYNTGNDEFYFCAGNDVYVYRLDKKLTNTATAETPSTGISPWVLIRYESSSCPIAITAAPSVSVPASGDFSSDPGYEELLSANQRLGQLSLTPSTSSSGTISYTINIIVANGDNDLLKDWSNGGENNATSPSKTYTYLCQPGSDNSFCAVSSLTTTVAPRINNP